MLNKALLRRSLSISLCLLFPLCRNKSGVMALSDKSAAKAQVPAKVEMDFFDKAYEAR